MTDIRLIRNDTGARGPAATVEVGSTNTRASGEDATVTNSGDQHEATLDFGIPAGPQAPPMNFRGTWDSGTVYSQSDAVVHDAGSGEKLWGANQDTDAGDEPGTSAKWTDITDAFDARYAPISQPACKVVRDTNLTVPNDTITVVPWESAAYDTDGMWDDANPDVLTVPEGGLYRITASVRWDSNSTGRRKIAVRADTGTGFSGVTQDTREANHTSDGNASVNLELSAGDQLHIFVRHLAGGDLDVDQAMTFLSAEKLQEVSV